MKIAIIGSHGTGKTTLANELSKLYPECFLIPEIARVFGIEKINTQIRTLFLQEKMMDVQIYIESLHQNFIADRSILDFGVYGQSQKFLFSTQIYTEKMYTHIFFIPIRFMVFDDGFRNLDEKFRNEIQNRFLESMPTSTIIIKSLSISDRIAEIQAYI